MPAGRATTCSRFQSPDPWYWVEPFRSIAVPPCMAVCYHGASRPELPDGI